ncbi:MAG TPA: hypothetical protein DCO75_05400 [Fibrobacteres bacterium]|jgi:hypothetical protein|nr:hypothetical protein [Fibrobacterota bacterium]
MIINILKFKNIYILTSLFVLVVSCIFSHESVNCRAVFYFSVMNNTQDTITVKLNNRGRDIEKFSDNDYLVLPQAIQCDTVYYKWTGADYCYMDCSDKSYNGQVFIAKFYRHDSLILEKDIVPCVPCDTSYNKLITICEDCPYEVSDTLVFSGN